MTYTNEELLNIFTKSAIGAPHNIKPSTVAEYNIYINYLLDYLENKSIFDITKKDVKIYLSSLNVSDSTYNCRLSAIKTLYKVLCDDAQTEDFFPYNPVSTLLTVRNVKHEVKVPLDEVERKMLIKYSKNDRDKAIITTLLNTGMRIEECFGLTLNQYLTSRDGDKFIQLTDCKRDKTRKISLNDDCISAIDKYLESRKDGCDLLFTSNHGIKMDRKNMSQTIKIIAKRSGYFTEDRIKSLANHLLRTTYASVMANDYDVPVELLSKIMGNGVSVCSKIYIKTDENNIEKAMSMKKLACN